MGACRRWRQPEPTGRRLDRRSATARGTPRETVAPDRDALDCRPVVLEPPVEILRKSRLPLDDCAELALLFDGRQIMGALGAEAYDLAARLDPRCKLFSVLRFVELVFAGGRPCEPMT
jgi:hypothetical protein